MLKRSTTYMFFKSTQFEDVKYLLLEQEEEITNRN